MEGGELGIQRLGRTDIHVQRQPIYGPTLGASHNGTVTDAAALEDDLEVAGAMSKAVAKTFLKRFISNEIIAAYDAKKVIEEPSFQDTLQNARFSSDWISDFGDLLENDDVTAALGSAIDSTAARPDDAPSRRRWPRSRRRIRRMSRAFRTDVCLRPSPTYTSSGTINGPISYSLGRATGYRT